MLSLPAALGRAAGQLNDPAILKVLAKSIAVTLGLLVALGLGAGAGVNALLAHYELAAGGELAAAVSALFIIVGGWLLFRFIALAVIQFFADEIVEAVERKHYPQALASARKLGWREELANSVRSTARAVLFNGAALVVAIPLLLTAIGPAVLFFVVNAWLLGRELQELAWVRHQTTPGSKPPIGTVERMLLGATIAGLLVVPIVNLLAPVLGAAAACHLVHRKKGAGMTADAHAA
ncbi:EI24 domain-containing protein [Parerythrobacter lacustris]|uniref:EI24 domain-containing protein n=1 Tax=Parerythrobacter lacustris TaxID=2969984 RepID=A0ABT1XN33_9SPHN|nr:EI24 domain-containing protein [Parerythrobacter lacustris]MCR2832336.1 EI24 domain-containing protein [Parerythrobacter lacustris]